MWLKEKAEFDRITILRGQTKQHCVTADNETQSPARSQPKFYFDITKSIWIPSKLTDWVLLLSFKRRERELPRTGNKAGERPVWFWHRECVFCGKGGVGGDDGVGGAGVSSFDSFMPLWHKRYVLSTALPRQQLQSKEIFFFFLLICTPTIFLLLFLLLSHPFSHSSHFLSSTLVRFLFSPSLFFPSLWLVQTWFLEFWVGNVQVCVSTHTFTLRAAAVAVQATMSLKKRLSFKRTWNFGSVSKLWLSNQASFLLWSWGTPFVKSAVFLIIFP